VLKQPELILCAYEVREILCRVKFFPQRRRNVNLPLYSAAEMTYILSGGALNSKLLPLIVSCPKKITRIRKVVNTFACKSHRYSTLINCYRYYTVFLRESRTPKHVGLCSLKKGD